MEFLLNSALSNVSTMDWLLIGAITLGAGFFAVKKATAGLAALWRSAVEVLTIAKVGMLSAYGAAASLILAGAISCGIGSHYSRPELSIPKEAGAAVVEAVTARQKQLDQEHSEREKVPAAPFTAGGLAALAIGMFWGGRQVIRETNRGVQS
jgi:hypothetical protein